MASILVIDDDAAVRGLFQAVLQSAGHTVSLAANLAEGYTVLRSSTIEMVITDFNMPQGRVGSHLGASSRLSSCYEGACGIRRSE